MMVSERLRTARREAGLTQEDVAARLGEGFSAASIYRWENGREMPSILKAIRLAELYGVSLDWLAGRTPLREIFRPGKVVVDLKALDRVEALVRDGGRLEDLPGDLIRHPGIDYAWRLPEEPTLMDGAAAANVEGRMRALLAELGARRRA